MAEFRENDAAAAVFDVIIVGGGPRAVATIERIDARVRAAGEPAASALVIDAVEVGAGATWRTDQTPCFLNNTTSASTTVYPDESTPIDGPAGDGPTFLEWARAVAERGSHEVPWAVEEARGVTPGSFPTRRLQGVYYNDQLARVSRLGGVTLARALGTVVDVARAGAADGARAGSGAEQGSDEARTVTLADGRTFRGRAVVLAQGMVQALPTQSVEHFADAAGRIGLFYIAPGMPAEQPWHRVPAGQPVIAQGLGANFYDVVAELTAGRGGTFEPIAGAAHGRLRYVPSGAEPIIFAASRRGVPYRSKGDYGEAGAPRFTAQIARAEWFDELLASAPQSLDFGADVWPFIAAEFGLAWLTAAEARTPGTVAVGLGEAQRALRAAAAQDVVSAGSRSWPGEVAHLDAALTALVPDERQRFRLDELRRPTLGAVLTAEEWAARVQRLVDDELESLASPRTSPHQAVSRAMAALRGRVSQLAVRGVLTPESEVRDVHGWFNADSLFLASGAPASRVREVLALIDAGVVQLVGPDTRVSVDEAGGVFRAASSISGIEVTARALIETRMSKGKVPSTSDPLLRELIGRGDARIHALRGADRFVETESIDAVPRDAPAHPLSLVDAAGEADPRVLVLGIPAGSTQPGSAIGAAPGIPSPLLAGADRAAEVVLQLRSWAGSVSARLESSRR
ncbi:MULTISPECIES: FAD/NAD(P)-binding domain-containing protein [unclassified Leucobacter]|uniref:FAD/NAD(P)-binding protein n=1 Tax=unclassified Leucobacter TaxID=2621730 RepID=UPI00165E5AA5|nr:MULTISPECIES: FAD/NAD(P)-binding protein [unclassified Leucobacter]MBC9937010.1 FAD/NAD(P)-binding protein [Leucobacter sp. cx-87]